MSEKKIEKYLASPIGNINELIFSDIPQELWGKQTLVTVKGEWVYFDKKIWDCNLDYLKAHFRLSPLKD